MVNSKVIRVRRYNGLASLPLLDALDPHFSLFSPSFRQGGGLIVLAGSYVLVERSFTNDVVGASKSMLGNLIGGGRGSMYNVSAMCSVLRLLASSAHPFALSIDRRATPIAKRCPS